MESEKKKIDLLKGEGDIKHITYVNAPKTFSEAISKIYNRSNTSLFYL